MEDRNIFREMVNHLTDYIFTMGVGNENNIVNGSIEEVKERKKKDNNVISSVLLNSFV